MERAKTVLDFIDKYLYSLDAIKIIFEAFIPFFENMGNLFHAPQGKSLFLGMFIFTFIEKFCKPEFFKQSYYCY